LRYAVETPERVADAILDAVAHGRTEVTVPVYYRAASLLQGIAPATLTKLASRRLPGR
jgi:hypothetical protein